jgi:hypothetical protein
VLIARQLGLQALGDGNDGSCYHLRYCTCKVPIKKKTKGGKNKKGMKKRGNKKMKLKNNKRGGAL